MHRQQGDSWGPRTINCIESIGGFPNLPFKHLIMTDMRDPLTEMASVVPPVSRL